MPKAMITTIAAVALGSVLWLVMVQATAAHHILGRPAYSLNEDSNTPSSIQGEALVDDYIITFMVFPAFPKPGEPGRIHLYVKPVGGGTPFQGKVAFEVQRDSPIPWLTGGNPVRLGVQPVDDNVFRQSFKFPDAGDYLVTARFEAGGKPYHIDFSLRVGAPPAFGVSEILWGVLFAAIVVISLVQRRRAMTGKIRSARDDGVKKRA